MVSRKSEDGFAISLIFLTFVIRKPMPLGMDLNAAINIRRSGMDALMSDSKTMLCGGHV